MSNYFSPASNLPPEQEAIRAKCFHPTGTFVEFQKEEIEQSIPKRFEKIVAQYPDRIAVKSPVQEFTYTELNQGSNQIAHAILSHRGCQPESVALMFENGAPLVAAILGVLKTGKFVTLLDPSFPKARVAFVLDDSRAKVIVADRRNASLAREVASSHCRI